MGRPLKDEKRVRISATLSPEAIKDLKDLSETTMIPMSRLLELMILECSKEYKEKVRKGRNHHG